MSYPRGVCHPKPCRHCGEIFTARPKQPPSDWVKKKFCSRRCSASFHKDERIAQMLAGRARAMEDPAKLEHFRTAARVALDKIRPLACAARTRNAVAWCPPEYRAAYRHLVYGKRLGLQRSREIIQEQIAVDARRQINRVTSEMQAKAAREKAQAY